MNEFKRFEDRLTGLIESLSPSGRRRLAVDIAKKLRQRQQQRIKLQKRPGWYAVCTEKKPASAK